MDSHTQVDAAIRNAHVATTEGCVDILIHDGRIASIMKSAGVRADVEIDAHGGLVTTGLVEPHVHLDKALTADRVPSGSVGDLRTRKGLEVAIRATRDIKRSFTVTDVRDRAIRAARMAARAGVTTLRTHIDVDPIVGLTGIRGVLEARETCAGLIDIQIVAFPQEGIFRSSGTEDLLRDAIRLGADAVGGAPALDERPQDHVRCVFNLAREFGLPVDMHVDESDQREDFTLPFVIEEARAGGVPSVTVAHISSLSVQTHDVARATILELADTGIHVVVNPIIIKITRLRELLDAGVSVMFGSDNVRDPFYPLGAVNPLHSALLACQIAALGTREDLRQAFDAVTVNPSRMTGTSSTGGVVKGAVADLAVFPSPTPEEVILDQQAPLAVIKGGRVVTMRHPADDERTKHLWQ
jgi:cytosine deaminase